MANKVELYICNGCDKPILKPEDGVVVHGNIYVADTQTKGGLIGNNFPVEHNSIERIKCAYIADVVKETAYCMPCFMSALSPIIKVAR